MIADTAGRTPPAVHARTPRACGKATERKSSGLGERKAEGVPEEAVRTGAKLPASSADKTTIATVTPTREEASPASDHREPAVLQTTHQAEGAGPDTRVPDPAAAR